MTAPEIGEEITEEQFSGLIRGVQRERVHFEAQRWYEEDAADLADWLDAGQHGRPPRTPDQIPGWAAYLDRVRAQYDRGVRLIRIRIIDEPPTDYQRWGAWAAPWYAAAGEQVFYLTRRMASRLVLPGFSSDGDWDLLDDERVILTRFTPGGAVAGSVLITDPGRVALYRTWRELALEFGTAATPAAA